MLERTAGQGVGDWEELCETGKSCVRLEELWDQQVSAEACQQGGVKRQSRIKMSWQTGLGVLFVACSVVPMVEKIAGRDQVAELPSNPFSR